MQKQKELVKFTLTPSMSLELIKFNNLKKQLYEIKELYNLDKNEKLLKQINEIEKNMINARKEFIKEFRTANVKEIEEYLKMKNQF